MSEGAQIHIDTRALEIASAAMQRVQSHEAVCEIRQAATMRELSDIKSGHSHIEDKLDGMRDRNDKQIYAVLGVVLMSLAYFLVKFGLPGVH